MREEQLKQIWNNTNSNVVPEIDFAKVESQTNAWQDKLKKRIKTDITFNAIAYLLMSPIFYYYPKSLYLIPSLLLVWGWFLWETIRLYRQDGIVSEFESTKDYLKSKKSLLGNYLFRIRLILYIGCPIFTFLAVYAMDELDRFMENIMSVVSILLIAQISMFVVCEIYLRMIYYPSVKQLNELLNQLELEE